MTNRIDEFEQGLKSLLTEDASLFEVPDSLADCSISYRSFIRASHRHKGGSVTTNSIEKPKVRYPESFTVIGSEEEFKRDDL